jgi:hypothetical protein
MLGRAQRPHSGAAARIGGGIGLPPGTLQPVTESIASPGPKRGTRVGVRCVGERKRDFGLYRQGAAGCLVAEQVMEEQGGMSGCVVSAAAWGGMEVLVEDCAGLGDQAANLALEEALVRAAPPRPLLRIWQNGACVVIGRGQQVWREVNMAACAASSVPGERRRHGLSRPGQPQHQPGRARAGARPSR